MKNKNLKIELIIIVFALVLMGLIIFLAYKLSDANSRAEVYQDKYNSVVDISNKKYRTDSMALVKDFNVKIAKRDSALTYANGQLSTIPKINKYYDAKIRYTQIAPTTVIDKQYDSVLTTLRHKYN